MTEDEMWERRHRPLMNRGVWFTVKAYVCGLKMIAQYPDILYFMGPVRGFTYAAEFWADEHAPRSLMQTTPSLLTDADIDAEVADMYTRVIR